MRGYKCLRCDFETISRGWRNAQCEIEDHLNEIHSEKPVGDVNVKSIPSTPAKKWTCPKCEEVMSYHLKFYHLNNKHK